MAEMKHVDRDQYKKMMRQKRLKVFVIILILLLIVGLALALKFYILPTVNEKKAPVTTEAPVTTTEPTTEPETEPESQPMDFTFEIPEGYAEKHTYAVAVNRQKSVITVFEKDEEGNYTVAVKAILCSCGSEKTKTPIGTFTTSDKLKWINPSTGLYSQYATRVSKASGIWFMSVNYTKKSNDALKYDDYNKLGTNCTGGSIKMCVADALWLYENLEKGTIVYVYDSDIAGVLGTPSAIRIDTSSEYRGWDPTDPVDDNPWKTVETGETTTA